MIKHIVIVALLWIGLAMPANAQEAPVIEPDQPFLNIQTVKTRGGLTAWLVEDHSLPIIAIEFGFKNAGAAQDPADLQGLARIMSNTLDEGAGDLDARAFQSALNDHSITLAYGTSRDDFTGTLKTLRRHKDKAFDLLRLSLTQPRFDEEAVTRMVDANQSRIRASLAKPEWIAARLMNAMAFDGHPYAQNSGGTLSSLDRITPDQLRAYHAKALARDNLVIAVTGAITVGELSGVLDSIFGNLPAKSNLKTITKSELQNQGQTWLYESDIPQTVIEIMQPGIARTDPDYQTAQIMNFILGSSGFGSRLTQIIREENGLTYGIYTGLANMDHFNGLSLSTSTQNATVQDMMTLIREQWQQLASQPVTAQELENAKNYLIGSVPLSLTSTDRVSGLMLSLQLDGLPVDYLDRREAAMRAVTIEDISALAARLLNDKAMSIIMVGKPAGITPDQTLKDVPDVQ